MTIKVALVTGAGKKLGAEISRALGRGGYIVVVHANLSEVDAKAVVEDIEKEGGRARLFLGDLTEPTIRDKLKDAVLRIGGGLGRAYK